MMRQPRNSLNKDTAEKPYNSENFDVMRKTTTNKQIEDIGGVTKHSEFEKPYKLNWNEDYGNMQNLHPSNYDFSFLDTSSPNFENNIPNIPSGGIGGIDPCKEILQKCGQNGAFNKYCGEAMAMGCLKVIGDCMTFNWNGGTSYDEAECFCENFGGDINQQYSENCVKEFCQNGDSCPPFTLEGSDAAPTTLQISGSAACIESVSGGDWSPGSSTIYVPDISGVGIIWVTVTDICGNQVTKNIKGACNGYYRDVEITYYTVISPCCRDGRQYGVYTHLTCADEYSGGIEHYYEMVYSTASEGCTDPYVPLCPPNPDCHPTGVAELFSLTVRHWTCW